MTAPAATRMANQYRYEPGPRHSSGSLYASTPRYASSRASEYSLQVPPSSSFSSVPTSVTSLSHPRGRRNSGSDQKPRSILRNGSVHSPERSSRPVVVQQRPRDPSRSRARSRSRPRGPSPPPTRVEQRVIVPASSINRRRSVSRRRAEYGSPSRPERSPQYISSGRSHRGERRSYHGGNVYHEADSKEYHRSADVPRRGRTKIPQKLVCVEAVEALDYSYTLEGEHVVVHQALTRPDIERLVELSEEFKRTGRLRSAKAVSFYEQTIVHDVAPESPPASALTFYDHEQHIPPAEVIPPPPSSISEQQLAVARYEPLMPPGPGTPIPGTVKRLEISTPAIPVPGKSSAEKLARAEERAARAAEVAAIKEERAMLTGSPRDEREALKARNKAEELMAKVEERERRERMKYEEKARRRYSTGETVIGGRRIARNHKGEVVVIKDPR